MRRAWIWRVPPVYPAGLAWPPAPGPAAGNGSAVLYLEPGHGPPAVPPPPPPRGKAGNKMKPPAIFRIAASAMRLRHPWPTQVGDLDADNAVRCFYCDRDRLAGGTRAASGRAHTGMHARLGGARQAGHAARVARPWPSAESRRCTPTATTVHTDRRNCAHRPSLQHGRPSAMRPWTAQYDGLQRDKVTHAGTEKKRPASARIRS
jgi:hypothetical protein